MRELTIDEVGAVSGGWTNPLDVRFVIRIDHGGGGTSGWSAGSVSESDDGMITVTASTGQQVFHMSATQLGVLLALAGGLIVVSGGLGAPLVAAAAGELGAAATVAAFSSATQAAGYAVGLAGAGIMLADIP